MNLEKFEQLGPMVKLPMGGFNLTSLGGGYNSGPGSQDGEEPEIVSTSGSFLTSSTSSFPMHSLILKKGPNLPQKGQRGNAAVSKNAQTHLFPINAEKLLLVYPGKEGEFAKARISLQIEEVKLTGTQLLAG
jgi:hypothetical protein